MTTKPKRKPPTRKPPLRPNKRDRERFRLFAEAYLAVGQPTYLNAMQSAIAAGYSEATAKGSSYRLLDNAGIQGEMKRLRDSRSKLSTIATPAEILEVLTTQMRVLPNKLMDGGELIPLDKLDDQTAHAIAGAKTKTRTIQAGEDTITEVTLEYKLVDRTRCAVELAKHHGLFEKDNEQQKPDVPPPLVLMTDKPLTLAEWAEQAQKLQEATKIRQSEAKP